jgi:hypothetical protein
MTDFRKKLLIQIGITVGSIVLLGILIAYVFGDVRSVGESIRATRAALVARTQAISSLSELRTDAARATLLVNQLRNALPSRESLFIFSEDINRIARENNITPTFSFGSEIAGSAGTPSKIEFLINVAGDYQAVLSFINSLESSRYFTRVKSVELLSQGANTTAYQAIMSGEIFFRE